jgi:hypothetical protein
MPLPSSTRTTYLSLSITPHNSQNSHNHNHKTPQIITMGFADKLKDLAGNQAGHSSTTGQSTGGAAAGGNTGAAGGAAAGQEDYGDKGTPSLDLDTIPDPS